MADWRDLQDWLLAPGDTLRCIAGDAADHIHEPAFRARIAAWQSAMVGRRGQHIALHLDDPLEFAAALLAGWSLHNTLVLPADLHAETLAALRGGNDAFIADKPLPADITVLTAPATTEHDVQADRLGGGLRLFTSGSSGAPQAIDKRLDQLQAELGALQQLFGATLGDCRVVATVSQQHIYGLLFRVLWPLCAGRAFARTRLQYPEQIAAALSREPAVLASTPAHLSRLPDLPEWPAAAAKLRVVFSSGGALDAATARLTLERLGQLPIEVYGSTETGGIAWRRQHAADAAWQPLPGVSWRVDGELLQIRSPFLPDATSWQPTCDRAEPAGDSFRLLGRADRIVKVEQRRVSLGALEAALCGDPRVAVVRVVLLQERRDTLGAVVVVADGEPIPSEAVQRRAWIAGLRERLAAVADPVCWPRRWRFVDTLPVDARGKTSEAALRRLFVSDRPEPAWLMRDADAAQLQCVLDPALRVFAGHFPEAPVLPGVALLDWIGRWAGEGFQLAGEFRGMEQLKFQRIARPGMTLNIQLQRRADGGRVDFVVGSAAGQHASGRLLFGPPV